MDKIIGVDLGGTNVRAGLVEARKVVAIQSRRIKSQGIEEEVLRQIFEVIDNLDIRGYEGIGVGAPSIVDVEKGIVYDVVNIPSWKEVPLKSILERRYQLPVKVNNDANCFALADFHFGKGQGYSNMIGLIMGTGLAGGVIINGRLYEGANCGAGEFGEISYLDSCYEHYCCGQFFERKFELSGEEVSKMAFNKERRGLEIMEEFGRHVGKAITTILFSHDPEIIVLGGSVSKSYGFFKTALWRTLEGFTYSPTVKKLKIEVSDLDNPGILGAAALFI